MMDASVWAALIGAIATVIVGLGGGLAARRWGLPGLGRAVETEQGKLIAALQGRIGVLEAQHDDDVERIAALEACQDKLEDMGKQLASANADIAQLWRQQRTPGTPRTARRQG